MEDPDLRHDLARRSYDAVAEEYAAGSREVNTHRAYLLTRRQE
jgi:hypothetical protein